MNKKSQKFYDDFKNILTNYTGLGTEYSISPQDFESLLNEEKITMLLKSYFSVTILKKDNNYIALLPDDKNISLDDLYIKAELCSKTRFEMYQIGMSIWR